MFAGRQKDDFGFPVVRNIIMIIGNQKNSVNNASESLNHIKRIIHLSCVVLLIHGDQKTHYESLMSNNIR